VTVEDRSISQFAGRAASRVFADLPQATTLAQIEALLPWNGQLIAAAIGDSDYCVEVVDLNKIRAGIQGGN
jgi:hypothetical protein